MRVGILSILLSGFILYGCVPKQKIDYNTLMFIDSVSDDTVSIYEVGASSSECITKPANVNEDEKNEKKGEVKILQLDEGKFFVISTTKSEILEIAKRDCVYYVRYKGNKK